MLINLGYDKIPNISPIFVHPSPCIKCVSKIKYGRSLNIGGVPAKIIKFRSDE